MPIIDDILHTNKALDFRVYSIGIQDINIMSSINWFDLSKSGVTKPELIKVLLTMNL